MFKMHTRPSEGQASERERGRKKTFVIDWHTWQVTPQSYKDTDFNRQLFSFVI